MTKRVTKIWGEDLDVHAQKADRAARALRKAGKGALVVSTRYAKIFGLFNGKEVTGEITSFGPHKWMVHVRRNGRKTQSSYYVAFWRPL